MTLRKGLRLAPFTAILFCFSSCADLPDIPENTCGNGIVDSDEYCDSFAAEPGTMCRAPGTSGACNFDCTGTNACPTNWACGNDQLCRPPGGDFGGGTSRIAVDSARLATGDFDGDGRKDVLAIGAAQLSIQYFDPTGLPASSYAIPSGNLLPAVGGLTLDKPDDIAFPLFGSGSTDFGVAVLLGEQDRTLSAAAYPTLAFPAQFDARFVGQFALTAFPGPTSAPFVFVSFAIGGVATFGLGRANQTGAGLPTVVIPLPGKTIADLPGDAAHGNVDERPTSPCEEIAFGLAGDSNVSLYTPCYADMNGIIAWNDPVKKVLPIPVTTVALPANVTVAPDRGVMLVDVNGDNHLDLAIPVLRSGTIKDMFVAYNFGDGTLHSSFVPMDPADVPNTASPMTKLSPIPYVPVLGKIVPDFPLAIAQLNDDGLPDFVMSSGIFVSRKGALDPPAPGFDAAIQRDPGFETSWTEAVVADFNNDGLLDVVAGSGVAPSASASTTPSDDADQLGLDFYAGASFSFPADDDAGVKNAHKAFFNHTLLPTNGPPVHLAVGDFDGDFVNDIAINQVGVPDGDAGALETIDTPAILFGQANGAPLPPKAIGQLDHVIQVIPVNLSSSMDQDLIEDLGVVSIAKTGGVDLSIVSGRTDRLILAPFGISDANLMYRDGPIRVAIGQFTGDTHPDVASVDADSTASVFNFWISPATGSAEVTTSNIGASPIPVDFNAKTDDPKLLAAFASRCLLASGDLNPKKTGAQELDELVFVMPLKGGQGGARIVIARVSTANATAPAFGAPAAGDVADVASAQLIEGLEQGQLELADLDGDGAAEILLLAQSGTSPAVIQVFWNNGDGTFDLTKPPSLIHAADPTEAIQRFIPIQLDLDPQMELAVVTQTTAFVVNASSSRALTSTPEPGLVGGRAITAGDVNGDGLVDLAISDGENVSLFLAKPVPAGDPRLSL